MNILSDVIEIEKPYAFSVDYTSHFDPEALRSKLEKLHTQGFVTSEFHLENIVKMIYLNNADPQKFNFELWAEYHKVPVERIRDLMIHVNFPVVKNEKVVGRIAFVDIPKPKTITDLNEENVRRFTER
jgi:hypothetical protein